MAALSQYNTHDIKNQNPFGFVQKVKNLRLFYFYIIFAFKAMIFFSFMHWILRYILIYLILIHLFYTYPQKSFFCCTLSNKILIFFLIFCFSLWYLTTHNLFLKYDSSALLSKLLFKWCLAYLQQVMQWIMFLLQFCVILLVIICIFCA